MFHKMDFIFSLPWILCVFVSGSQGETYSISYHACHNVMSSSSLSHYVFDVMMTFILCVPKKKEKMYVIDMTHCLDV